MRQGLGTATVPVIGSRTAAMTLQVETQRALALAWLGGLDARRRAVAIAPFDRRTDWGFTPRERPGIALRDLEEPQRVGLWALVDHVLSEHGRELARGVRLTEQILGELTDRPDYRDPNNYALAVFGEPSADAPWGWRFEGHHLSLTMTHVPGQGIAVTPAFFGSNPAIIPHGHSHAGFELLEVRRRCGFALLASLDGARRERAVIAKEAPVDFLTIPGSERRLTTLEGVPFNELADGQRALGWALIESFTGHLAGDLRAAAQNQIKEQGLDNLHFGWAGTAAVGEPHYYRLHGPITVIEYDNVQSNANHAHSVWHEPHDVFGDDRLRRHHLEAHG